MDSMRSLNTSLPGGSSPPKRMPTADPPEHLLQAFKDAAFYVSTLYKTAARDSQQARRDGYHDAIEDLLGFLDRRNIGVSDGEGWAVRQWATGKMDGKDFSTGTDSEDEREDLEKRARSSSPVVQHVPAQESQVNQLPTQSFSPARNGSAPPSSSTTSSSGFQPVPFNMSSENFNFQSSIPFPTQDSSTDFDVPDHNPFSHPPSRSSHTTQHSNNPSVRVDILPHSSRPSRSSNRHSHSSNPRMSTRSSNSLGGGAGYKRRAGQNYDPNFFDISGFHGGGHNNKRGRMS
jgi:hypothetical protein